ADDQPVRRQAEREAGEVAHGHLTLAFDVLLSALELEQVAMSLRVLRQLKLESVLDGDEPLVRIDRVDERSQQRRLARVRSADDQPVRRQAEREAGEVAHGHLTLAFDVLLSALELEQVAMSLRVLRQLKLESVLDGDEPLVRIDRVDERSQQRRLARVRSA